jgi:hypothetical protein
MPTAPSRSRGEARPVGRCEISEKSLTPHRLRRFSQTLLAASEIINDE